jgi:phosphate transport system substrate-binding protein
MRRAPLLALLALLALVSCSKAAPTGPAPYQIHIAGSSAGFPLSSEVAERLMREDPDVLAPLVRAGGTGEGIARFCDRGNPTRPDILITTRRMTAEEQARCAADGSTDIEQREIGTTAVVLVESKGGLSFPGLDRIDVAKALTSNAKTWADVRSGLPAVPIAIHGPTPTPAIADTLYGPLLQDGQKVRTDGAYTGHGADAELVARIVAERSGAVGIIPLTQALAHRNTLSTLPLGGIEAAPAGWHLYSAPLELFLVSRPNDVRHVPGLQRLIGYYGDALVHHHDDVEIRMLPD